MPLGPVKESPSRKQPPNRMGTLARLFRPKALSPRHPRVTDRTRTFLATLTFPELVLGFVILIIATTLLSGFSFWVLAPKDFFTGFADALSSSFFTLIGMAPSNLDPSKIDGAFKVAVGGVGLGSLLLPALFLGAIVFRLFVRLRVFVLRGKPLLTHTEVRGQKGWFLAVRLYSSTTIVVVDIDFKIYLRMENPERHLLRNEEVEVANPTWPIADTHIPFTIYMPLREGDLSRDKRLVSVQGHALDNCANMVIHIRGAAPQLASEFNESHLIAVPTDLKPANFVDVDVLYDGRGVEWAGWDQFEEDTPA